MSAFRMPFCGRVEIQGPASASITCLMSAQPNGKTPLNQSSWPAKMRRAVDLFSLASFDDGHFVLELAFRR